MKKILYFLIFLCIALISLQLKANDTLAIHWQGHASVYFEFNGLVIYIDPNSDQADYSSLPKADLVCITHAHGDHYDLNALTDIKKDSTLMIYTQEVEDLGTYTDTSVVLSNWDSLVYESITIKAVPAYNIAPGQIFHAKGDGNGYIFTFNDRKVYLAGDTENIPEMDSLGKIDIAFIPMNLPYTMTPEQASEAAHSIAPNILYIYHFGTSDTALLRNLINDTNIEIATGQHVRYENTIGELPYVSTERITTKDNFIFYPNPATELLQIINPLAGTELYFYNTLGVLLQIESLSQAGLNTVDLKLPSRGIYLVKFKNKENENYKTLLKL